MYISVLLENVAVTGEIFLEGFRVCTWNIL
jgi:hypothetical protein